MKIHKTLRLRPGSTRPREFHIDGYFDGEWLVIKTEGVSDQIYWVLSHTQGGAAALGGKSEGFYDDAAQMQGDEGWLYVPRSKITVPEGSAFWASAWTSPEGMDTLWALGDVFINPATRRDRTKTKDVPDLAINSVSPISVGMQTGAVLEVPISLYGGLPPVSLEATIGEIVDGQLLIPRDESLSEIVTVTARDSRGETATMRFGLTVEADANFVVLADAFTISGVPLTVDGEQITYGD